MHFAPGGSYAMIQGRKPSVFGYLNLKYTVLKLEAFMNYCLAARYNMHVQLAIHRIPLDGNPGIISGLMTINVSRILALESRGVIKDTFAWTDSLGWKLM